ncbi:hypothetical protein HPB48_022660 [Haemaphysalis longicornis]|uniref:ABC transporter domain-containing protein n=1 Tax=Haemaphysalis longicornis TaxID=44386 RepID=A0A9J6FXC3_HAELO|nr:hypothetical protein HPB48_022660 [Haemaphysalis longicornis]
MCIDDLVGGDDSTGTTAELTGVEILAEVTTERTNEGAAEVVYRNKFAVDHLSLRLYYGQILALLGHNGAGKTTIASMLSGFLRPTFGTAIIEGFDLIKNHDDSLVNVRICPQRELLYEEMTVYEHLYYFATVREISSGAFNCEIAGRLDKEQYMRTILNGVLFFEVLYILLDLDIFARHMLTNANCTRFSSRQNFLLLKVQRVSQDSLVEQIEVLVKSLHFGQHLNNFPRTLSGTMKKKLSLAIAIVADPKVLILDEPTEGLDPKSRHEVWDLLQKMRRTCTMLLMTHDMEEADVLGDRIAIIAEGAIRCCGSSQFLKQRFGTTSPLTSPLVGWSRSCNERDSCDQIPLFRKTGL